MQKGPETIIIIIIIYIIIIIIYSLQAFYVTID